MGYFSQKFGIVKSIREAEADGQDLTGNDPKPADYAETENTNQSVEQPAENSNTQDNNPTENEDNQQQDPQPDNVESPTDDPTPDYTEMGDSDLEGEPIDNNGEGESSPEDIQNEPPVNELKAQEEEILGLSPEELNVKHSELKSLFLKLYDSTNTIIDRIGNISVNNKNSSVINFISRNLADLRTMVVDYLDEVYSTKSYTENSITYNRFVAVLHGINKMLEELGKNND